MMKKNIILAAGLVLLSLSAWAQMPDSARKNIVKLNLVTPFSITPTFELGYERILDPKFGLEFNAGIVTGMITESTADPFVNDQMASPFGYRLTLAPKIYFNPVKAPASGMYIAPTVMFKQIFDEYEVEYGMGEDDFGWHDYIQVLPAKYKKQFIDFSIRFGYQSKDKFVVDFYGGIGVRWKHVVEDVDVNVAYEGQPYRRLSGGPYNDFISGNFDGERSSITYSMPIGVKVGYRF